MPGSKLMQMLLMLAPNLARMTVASPHLITPVSVAGYSLHSASVPQRVQNSGSALQTRQRRMLGAVQYPPKPTAARSSSYLRAPQPAMVAERIDFRNGLAQQTGAAPIMPEHLVWQDDTWHSTPELPEDVSEEQISDASLGVRKTTTGTEWEIRAPITFSYRVKETRDVLDPADDSLLFGHITDQATLARAKARSPMKRVVVVDEEVHRLYGHRIEAYFVANKVDARIMALPTKEENKDIELTLEIAKAIDEHGIDRRLEPVIAIGGGVCMDIVGFAASIYRRRTPYIRVPTTLMGYVDASVGAKSGINFNGKKNKLGAYIPPALALLDRSFLATLDQRQLSNGAAEIMKMALVKSPELFSLLERHGPTLIEYKFQDLPASLAGADGPEVPQRVLQLAIGTMLEELAPNLWEDSLVRLVDFGHIFSVELEMEVLHSEKLFHGEAVAIDMAYSTVLAFVRGHIDADTRDRILSAMAGLRLPVYHEAQESRMIAKAMYERAKFSQGQKMPLPSGEGISRIYNNVTEEQLEAALALHKQLCAPPSENELA